MGRPFQVGEGGVVRQIFIGFDAALAGRINEFYAHVDVLVPGHTLTHTDIIRMLLVRGLDAAPARTDDSRFRTCRVAPGATIERVKLGLDAGVSGRIDAFRADVDKVLPANAFSLPDILRMLLLRGLAATERPNDAQLCLNLEFSTTTAT